MTLREIGEYILQLSGESTIPDSRQIHTAIKRAVRNAWNKLARLNPSALEEWDIISIPQEGDREPYPPPVILVEAYIRREDEPDEAYTPIDIRPFFDYHQWNDLGPATKGRPLHITYSNGYLYWWPIPEADYRLLIGLLRPWGEPEWDRPDAELPYPPEIHEYIALLAAYYYTEAHDVKSPRLAILQKDINEEWQNVLNTWPGYGHNPPVPVRRVSPPRGFLL